MQLIINGKEQDCHATTVQELLAELGLAGKPVVCELNTVIIPAEKLAQTKLAPNDRLELVQFVGGG